MVRSYLLAVSLEFVKHKTCLEAVADCWGEELEVWLDIPSSRDRRKTNTSGFRLGMQVTANSCREGGGARLMVSLPAWGTATEKSSGLREIASTGFIRFGPVNMVTYLWSLSIARASGS